MSKIFCLLCFLSAVLANAQLPEMKVSKSGFEPVVVSIPTTSNEKLTELTKAWLQEIVHNNPDRGKGYEVSGVTENSATVTGYKRNAFFYRSLGETYNHNIDYTMQLVFRQNSYDVTFTVNQIYTDNNVAVKSALADYFTNSGGLKEGYYGLDASLNKTVNALVQSHYDFILSHR
ncbi:hypothetical protein GR160_11865 [Flavobacterium sp. Sd200]|uniref:hypothetical protein n=1 Tax=Flavobacterium sp. Sd200 TaxID=2692211 RepID=UPI0013680593|nr:hypothetical protein [Flavobacterium sp. Sd200]MXN91920.1 hypothetical protein [Flavobacterium sp. Sd200]